MRWIPRVTTVMLLLVAVGAAAACGSSGPKTSVTVTPVPGGTAELTVTMGDFYFDPNAITVPAGQRLRLVLPNVGKMPHNWHLLSYKGPDGKEFQSAVIQGGQSSQIELVVSTPGTYKFRCDVHPDVMTGTLIVTGS